MSEKEGGDAATKPIRCIIDSDLFFFFLRGGHLEKSAAGLIERASAGDMVLMSSSELYDDIISAVRGRGNPLDLAIEFIADMKAIPHVPIAISPEVAEEALNLYKKHGGTRRLHYFDAFHVATAKRYDLPIVTSDRYILEHQKELKVTAKNLADFRG